MHDYAKVREYLEERSGTEFSVDRAIQASLALRKIVKPVLPFAKNAEPPVWFYIGVKNDYIVVPRMFCSCKDFVINVMSMRNKPFCKHLVLQFMSEVKGMYRIVAIPSVSDYSKIINEILSINISPTLRKLLYESTTVKRG